MTVLPRSGRPDLLRNPLASSGLTVPSPNGADWPLVRIKPLSPLRLVGCSSGLWPLSLLGLTLSWPQPGVGRPCSGLDFTAAPDPVAAQCEAACEHDRARSSCQALRELSLPAETPSASPKPGFRRHPVLLDENRTVVLRLPVLSPARDPGPDRRPRRACSVPLQTSGTEVKHESAPAWGGNCSTPAIASLLVSFTGIALYIRLSLQPLSTPFWPCSASPRRAEHHRVWFALGWDCSVALQRRQPSRRRPADGGRLLGQRHVVGLSNRIP